MTTERRDDSGLEPGQLHVDLDGEAEPRREGERVVERRRLRRQVGPVGEHERAVGAAEHVELDRVDPERGRRLDRSQAVLGGQGGRAAVPDPDDVPLAPQQLQHRASIAPEKGY